MNPVALVVVLGQTFAALGLTILVAPVCDSIGAQRCQRRNFRFGRAVDHRAAREKQKGRCGKPALCDLRNDWFTERLIRRLTRSQWPAVWAGLRTVDLARMGERALRPNL